MTLRSRILDFFGFRRFKKEEHLTPPRPWPEPPVQHCIYIVTPHGIDEAIYRERMNALFKETNMRPVVIDGYQAAWREKELAVNSIPSPPAPTQPAGEEFCKGIG